MSEFEHVTTEHAVAVYRASSGLFAGLLSEMRELSKKKPDVTLNKNKVKILNRVLCDIQGILKSEPEGKYLDFLDDDELPQNSDAVFIMVQFEKALHAFNKRYYKYIKGNWYWITEKSIKEKNWE